jgi:probable addiction module antidote protein
MPRKSHKESVISRLRSDPSYVVEYVNSALEDGDEGGFLIALRNVSEARQMSKVADDAGVRRESLYRMLSEAGNPSLSSLTGVLKAVGLRLVVAPDRTS